MIKPTTSQEITILPKPIETPLTQIPDFGWIKCENSQHTQSVKYRLVYSRIIQGMTDAKIHKGSCLIEASAGSTGVALAWAGKKLGHPVEIHSYDMPNPKYDTIRELGAKLVLWPQSTPFEDIMLQIKCKSKLPTYWHLNQYNRKMLTNAYRDYGREIYCQMCHCKERPDVFFAPVGTGGIIHGIGEYLKLYYPDMQIIAFEPEEGSSIHGMRNADIIQLGEYDPYDRSFPNDRIFIKDNIEMTQENNLKLGLGSQLMLEYSKQIHASKKILMIAVD
ncbi:MAG: pyridoxal-phosphate dependent enzyme [Planctomycetes bacterium]|nr:pyridoxal-phosphate dependent enzyme [Planctomycetota bacterium]